MNTPNWESVVTGVTSLISAIIPVLDVASPAVGEIAEVLSKIIGGVAAAEPTAIALYNQIGSGTPVTAEQLQTYITAYDAAYAQLDADIDAKLASPAT